MRTRCLALLWPGIGPSSSHQRQILINNQLGYNFTTNIDRTIKQEDGYCKLDRVSRYFMGINVTMKPSKLIYKTKYGVCWCMVINEKGQLRFKVTYPTEAWYHLLLRVPVRLHTGGLREPPTFV